MISAAIKTIQACLLNPEMSVRNHNIHRRVTGCISGLTKLLRRVWAVLQAPLGHGSRKFPNLDSVEAWLSQSSKCKKTTAKNTVVKVNHIGNFYSRYFSTLNSFLVTNWDIQLNLCLLRSFKIHEFYVAYQEM